MYHIAVMKNHCPTLVRNLFLTLTCLIFLIPGAVAKMSKPNRANQASMVMVSPHQGDQGLSYAEAIARINSPRHQMFLKAMDDIHRALGLKSTNINGAGMYQHAGENTSAITYPSDSQAAAVRAAAAAMGYVANQKQVLLMRPHPDGEYAIYSLLIPEGKMPLAFEVAERNLVAYTLVPNKENPAKGLLIIAENEYSGSLEEAANLIADTLGVSYDVVFGSVEFLGDPDDRTKASAILRREALLHPALRGKGWQIDYFRTDDGEGGLYGGPAWNRLDLWRDILNTASPEAPRPKPSKKPGQGISGLLSQMKQKPKMPSRKR